MSADKRTRLIEMDEAQEIATAGEETTEQAPSRSPLGRDKRAAQSTMKKPLPENLRAKIIEEQFTKHTYEVESMRVKGTVRQRRVPIGQVVDRVRQGIDEAQDRLQMVKVYVEIAMMGQDRELVERLIREGKEMVGMRNDQSGTYGVKRTKLISETHELLEAEKEMDILAEVERLPNIRSMMKEEKE